MTNTLLDSDIRFYLYVLQLNVVFRSVGHFQTKKEKNSTYCIYLKFSVYLDTVEVQYVFLIF